VKYIENETVEFKKSTSELKEAVISLGAMLNKHNKGTVYFGISDDGSVLGQQIGKSTLKDISKAISDFIDPKVYPEIQIKKIQGKDCIVINVSGQDNVYSARGRYYLRMGEENKKLSVDELRRLVEKKNNYAYSWGSEVSEFSFSKADIPTIKKFVEKGRKAGRIEYAYDSARNVLNKLHLIKGNKLLNAGRALFCEDSGIEVQLAVFAGQDKLTFLDIQSFRVSLFSLIERCEVYVKEHINWRADLSGSTRVEIPEIPVRAIKEAIINSLCHRDFYNPKNNEIAIYRDRIEIYNPGPFPYGHEPDEFIAGKGKSYPRNPLIAEAFYLTKDIERWGSGLRRIKEECDAAGVRVVFEKVSTGFQVIFYRPASTVDEKTAKEVNQKTTQKKVPERVTEKVPERVTENQQKIIESISKNQHIIIAELAQIVGISERKIKTNILKLKGKGLLRRIGPDKGGHWEVLRGPALGKEKGA
jgi:ATP-dependent DNA helicase RecG